MADQEQREQESRESDDTKFHELRREEAEERHDAAERLQDEPPLEPRDNDAA